MSALVDAALAILMLSIAALVIACAVSLLRHDAQTRSVRLGVFVERDLFEDESEEDDDEPPGAIVSHYP